MEDNFWIIHLDNSYATVGLAMNNGGLMRLTSVGPSSPWTILDADTAIAAVDESLSQAANDVNLPPDTEPSLGAFVVPPTWISDEGKISSQYLKIIEGICKKLDIKPLGFISHDEAILEVLTNSDGLPPSYIFVYLNPVSFDISLVYLGKIKYRNSYDCPDGFSPALLEMNLASINSSSALPPEIKVAGHFDQSQVDNLRNFSWLNKKNIETFLHFPNISSLSRFELFDTFLKSISNQFGHSNHPSPPKPHDLSITTDNLITPEVVSESLVDDEVDEVATPSTPESVEPIDFGFAPVIEDESPIDQLAGSDVYPQVEAVTNNPSPQITPSSSNPIDIPKPKFKLPTLSIPRIKFSRWLLYVLAISPLLILIPVLLIKTKVTITINPYTFNLTKNIDLESVGAKNKTVNVNASVSIPATGTKTIGEKATGTITIFNQSSKSINLPKGTILTTSDNLKFETTATAQIIGATANFETGIITMGQTKINIIATNIGTEYNLTKDKQLTISEGVGGGLVGKVTEGLVGGTKNEVTVVSATDKANITTAIKEKIKSEISSATSGEISSLPGILSETLIIKNQRIELDREVGEESDTASANSTSTISVYYLEDSTKLTILNQLFSDNPDFTNAQINPADFQITFTPDTKSSSKSTGNITVTGNAMPKIDTSSLKTKIAGKFKKQAQTIIINLYPRTTSLDLGSINPLPFVAKNITIDIQK